MREGKALNLEAEDGGNQGKPLANSLENTEACLTAQEELNPANNQMGLEAVPSPAKPSDNPTALSDTVNVTLRDPGEGPNYACPDS